MIQTNVDKLLEILKQKGTASVKDLAAALNTNPETIEKIAKLLEEEKLVTFHYKMMQPWLVYGHNGREKKGKKKHLFTWKTKEEQLEL